MERVYSAEERFVLDESRLASAPLVPEVKLHLASEVTPLWHATESWLKAKNIPPPYWAFAWAGGQAVARYLLDHGEVVRGRSVLDVASGGGIVAIAAALAGARVTAVDIDPFAAAAATLNAEVNGVTLDIRHADLSSIDASPYDAITLGDVCYEADMAAVVMGWLRRYARQKTAILGDPGRAYTPVGELSELARYVVPTDVDLEGKASKEAVVWRVLDRVTVKIVARRAGG